MSRRGFWFKRASLGRILPYVNFVVATTALTFQIAILYPWHIQLENDFIELRQEQILNLTEFHHLKVQKLNEIEETLVDVKLQLREHQAKQKNK